MKTALTISAALLLALSVSAGSFRVKNQGFGAEFLQINQAIAAASDDDTTYLERSPDQYVQLNLHKSVEVADVGYFLTAINIPNGSLLKIKTGFATVTVANIKLLGLHFKDAISVLATNVTIQPHLVNGYSSISTGAQNTTIIQKMTGDRTISSVGNRQVFSNNFISYEFEDAAPAVITQSIIYGVNFVSVLAPFNSTASKNIYYNFSPSVGLPVNNLFLNKVSTFNNGNIYFFRTLYFELPLNST